MCCHVKALMAFSLIKKTILTNLKKETMYNSDRKSVLKTSNASAER